MRNGFTLLLKRAQTDKRMFVLALLLGILPVIADPSQKIWHTEPSPLLLQELQDSARQSHLGGEMGLAVYSVRYQRFEAEWNDTDRFESSFCNVHDKEAVCDGVPQQPNKTALALAHLARPPYGSDSIKSLARRLACGGKPCAVSNENFILKKSKPTDSLLELDGYVFAADGDTLAVAMERRGSQGDHEAASSLMDSLFSQTTHWYNKERPSEERASALLSSPGTPSSYIERLRYFSRALMGTPYSLGPTGEGRYGAIEPLPIADLNHFDCVTYIESAVGLALSQKSSDLIPAILPIRYHGDTLSYATRNHFFVGDWLGNNPARFRILRFPGDTVAHKTLYKGKLLAAKGLPSPSPDPVADIPYLPYDKALQLAGNWPLGKQLVGVAFVTHIEGLDVTHTGFVDGESGKPVLRHASELKGKVVEQDFKEYLESRRGKCAGVLFFEFLPPPGGA